MSHTQLKTLSMTFLNTFMKFCAKTSIFRIDPELMEIALELIILVLLMECGETS